MRAWSCRRPSPRAMRAAAWWCICARATTSSRARANISAATMPESPDALLDALPEPALVIRDGGGIERANRAALAHFGAPLAGRKLTDLALGDPAPLKTYLSRCSGSRSPLVGSLTVRDPAGRAQ